MEENQEWFMYDEAGNQAVTKTMSDIKQLLSNKPLPEVRRQLHQKIQEVGQKHGEIYDSDVREVILSRLTRWACDVHQLRRK